MDEKEIISEQIESEDKPRLKGIFTSRNILNILLVLIVLNLIYLDILILQGGLVKTIEKIVSQPVLQTISSDQNSCPKDCTNKINEVAASFNKITPSITLSPTPSKVQNSQASGSNSVPKEYYVPFGSGSGSSLDWQDVPGLQAYVDSTAYTNMKSVIFEASLHIPTGNETASVRLYNATDGRVILNSQLDFNGNTSSVFLASQPISLDYGNKLYKVQIKTQLQYPAVLDQSRLHITTQ